MRIEKLKKLKLSKENEFKLINRAIEFYLNSEEGKIVIGFLIGEKIKDEVKEENLIEDKETLSINNFMS